MRLTGATLHTAPRRQDGRAEPVHVLFGQRRCNQRQAQHEVLVPVRSARQADVIRLQLRYGGARELVAFLERARPKGRDDLIEGDRVENPDAGRAREAAGEAAGQRAPASCGSHCRRSSVHAPIFGGRATKLAVCLAN